MTTVDKKIERTYTVGDYGGLEGIFDTLKDARKCLKERKKGRGSYIQANTIETIIITSSQIIQTLK